MWTDNRYLMQLEVGDVVAVQGIQLVTRVLDLKPDDINKPGAGGLTPLHRACARGALDLVQLLLSRGADIEKETEAKETPIHYACRRGNSLVIDALVKAGANLETLDINGKSILHQAALGGSIYALLYLESAAPQLSMSQLDNAGKSLLHYACAQGHKDLVRFLLKRSRCPVDLFDEKGNTCLHLVANTIHDDVAWILVMDGGAFRLLTAKNNEGDTPFAISQKHPAGDSRYRQIQGFFRVCNLASSPSHLSSQSLVIRLFLVSMPFAIFACAIIGSHFYPSWSTFAFCLAVFFCSMSVRMQSHRTMDASRKPNPIFMGAYAAGVAHSLICFYIDVLPYVRYTFIPKLAIALTPIHLLIYFSLLFRDPGSVSNGDDPSGASPSDNYCEALRRGALNLRDGSAVTDVYCTYCEKTLPSASIKHCKLCRRCYSDLDHHCLFLMTCVAKKNHRSFIWLIILSVVGITLFLWSAHVKFSLTCAVHTTPVTYAFCVLTRAPWTLAVVLFDAVSLIWGLYMMVYSLRAIGEGGTVYFRVGKGSRPSYVVYFLNIIFFLFLGRYYRPSEAKYPIGHGHSHGV